MTPASYKNDEGLTEIKCQIRAGTSNIVIWDIYGDASNISFKTKMSTF